jgi:hypothetical protein
MAQSSGIRASDAEREADALRLRTAAGEGRLEPDELEERLGLALGAVLVMKRRPRRPRLPSA